MISVHETEKLSPQQIEKFLAAAKEVRFEARERKEVYGWIERLLCQQEYAAGTAGAGSAAALHRQNDGAQSGETDQLGGSLCGQARMKSGRRHRFPQRYTRADIELRAQVDQAHVIR